MMKTFLRYGVYFYLLVFIASLFASLSVMAQEKTYIHPELIDMDTIREEEGLSEESEIEHSYFFLAIKNGQFYTIYATRGDYDLDEDNTKAWEEPNDLEEYVEVTDITRSFEIEGDSHVCYISALPHYEKLFKKEKLKDPFDDEEILEISTSNSFENENLLAGHKTRPIYNSEGSNIGIDRYIAFYNIEHVEEEDEEGNTSQRTVVTSFGIIKIRISD